MLAGKDVYEKYRNLRTTFFREHKRVSQAVNARPGDPSDLQPPGNVYVSKWRHYQNMLFLTKVDRSKNDLDNSGNHNDDSSSTDHLPPPAQVLVNGPDVEMDAKPIVAASSVAASTARAPPMDTSVIESPSSASLVQNSSNASATVVNHAQLSSHSSEDLILINTSDGSTAAVNGTILTTNGPGTLSTRVSLLPPAWSDLGSSFPCTVLLNTRMLSTSSANSRAMSVASIASIASNLNQSSPLTPTPHSVIYPLAGASGSAPFARIKSEGTTGDIQRQLTSSSNLIPMYPLSAQLPIALANQSSLQPIALGLNHTLAAAACALTSPHQVMISVPPTTTMAASTCKSNGVTVSPTHNSTVGSCRSQVSPVAMQSTPIQATRKGSLLFLTAKDHSPVVSTSSALALDNSTVSLEQSTNANGSFLFSGTSLVNASSISAVPSTPTDHQVTAQLPQVSAAGKHATALFSGTSISNSGKATSDYTEMHRDAIKRVVRETMDELEDEEMSFCKSLAASLRTLDRRQKEVAKLELQQVIVRHTNPSYSNNTLHSLAANFGFTFEEGNGGHRGSLRPSPNGGGHNGHHSSASTLNSNTVSTIKSATSNSDTSINCEKSANKLDNGPSMIAEGDSSNGHRRRPEKS